MQIRINENRITVINGNRWLNKYYMDCNCIPVENVADIARNSISRLFGEEISVPEQEVQKLKSMNDEEFLEMWKYKYRNRFSCAHSREDVEAGYIINGELVLCTLEGRFVLS